MEGTCEIYQSDINLFETFKSDILQLVKFTLRS